MRDDEIDTNGILLRTLLAITIMVCYKRCPLNSECTAINSVVIYYVKFLELKLLFYGISLSNYCQSSYTMLFGQISGNVDVDVDALDSS